jgi:putative ABC transport system permease protein
VPIAYKNEKPGMTISWSLWAGALAQGLAFAFLAWGVFLAFRVLRFADISVDGTFTLGAAVGAVLLLKGAHPAWTLPAAFIAGAIAGSVTGVIHTRFGVADLLSGILTMTALYSINLRVMGRANINLGDAPTLITPLESRFAATSSDTVWLLVLAAIVLVSWLFFAWFLKTDYGLALRATGDGPAMVSAQGVDTRLTITTGLGLSNGLAATAGALLMMFQGLADIGMGIGSLVMGLAAVILGEAFFGRRAIPLLLLGVAGGSILFRVLVALALQSKLDPNDLKLATAVFVLIALALPKLALMRRLGKRSTPDASGAAR